MTSIMESLKSSWNNKKKGVGGGDDYSTGNNSLTRSYRIFRILPKFCSEKMF